MKLLQKSLRSYIIYSILVLLISIPVFYMEINRMVAEDIEEDLLAHKMAFVSRLSQSSSVSIVVAAKPFEPEIVIRPAAPSQMPDSIYTTLEYDSLSNEDVPHRVLVSNVILNGDSYVLSIKRSLVDSDELIKSIVSVQAILVLLIIIGLLMIARFQSRTLWKPFYKTLQSIGHFKIESDESIHLSDTGIDEFTELNHSINQLTDRNRKAYLNQKEFTENASHELQTPIAVLQSKVELLMQTSPLSMEQAGLIAGLNDTAQRMGKLNRTLILLAKIENNQFHDTDTISMHELLRKVVGHFEDRLLQKNIISCIDVIEDYSVNANQFLLEILFNNLVSNAIRHNYLAGRIKIVINKNYVEISNTGKEEILDRSRLFQRFQKQSSDNNSLGLGLEIVKRIIILYGAEIVYDYRYPWHVFAVKGDFNLL